MRRLKAGSKKSLISWLIAGCDRGGALSLEIAATVENPIGLTGAEARRRLDEFGPNAIAEKASSAWWTFFAKFWAPVPWMLEGTVILQIGLDEYVEAAVIGSLLIFNAILGFLQESRATAALAALKTRLAPNVFARRRLNPGSPTELGFCDFSGV